MACYTAQHSFTVENLTFLNLGTKCLVHNATMSVADPGFPVGGHPPRGGGGGATPDAGTFRIICSGHAP